MQSAFKVSRRISTNKFDRNNKCDRKDAPWGGRVREKRGV